MNLFEKLEHRARMIAWHIFYRRPDTWAHSVQDNHRKLEIVPESEDACSFFVTGSGRRACVRMSNIRLVSPENIEVISETKGNERRLNADEQTFRNGTSIEQQFGYETTFAETTSFEKAFGQELKIGMETSIGTGEGSPVSAEFKFSTELTTTFSQTFGKQESVERKFSRSVTAPPRSVITVFGYREITDITKRIAADSDVTMDLYVWSNHKRHGRTHGDFEAWFTWDQFKELVKGHPMALNLSPEFQNNPLPESYWPDLYRPLERVERDVTYQGVLAEDCEITERPL